MLHERRNSEILAELDGHVVGHVEAKKALINLVNRSKIRHYQRWLEGISPEYLIQPHKLLLIGQSGTGKTHLVESLKQIIDFPLIRVDATKLNPTGASGGLKEEELRAMIVKNATAYLTKKNGLFNSLQGTIDQTVVFIDEIDKLGRSFESSGSWNTHVQSNFLTLFDNKAEFAGVSFIFAGAFNTITTPPTLSKPIGFNHQGPTTEGSNKALEEQVVDAGLIPELVGRFTNIVKLDEFSEEDLYNILVNRLLPKKKIHLAFFNTFDADLEEDELRDIVRRAYVGKQGVRGLQRALDSKFVDVEFDNEYKLHKPKMLGKVETYDEDTI